MNRLYGIDIDLGLSSFESKVVKLIEKEDKEIFDSVEYHESLIFGEEFPSNLPSL